jgi:hypothetical protein
MEEKELLVEKEKSGHTVIPCVYCESWWYSEELPKHDPNCPVLKEKNENR